MVFVNSMPIMKHYMNLISNYNQVILVQYYFLVSVCFQYKQNGYRRCTVMLHPLFMQNGSCEGINWTLSDEHPHLADNPICSVEDWQELIPLASSGSKVWGPLQNHDQSGWHSFKRLKKIYCIYTRRVITDTFTSPVCFNHATIDEVTNISLDFMIYRVS